MAKKVAEVDFFAEVAEGAGFVNAAGRRKLPESTAMRKARPGTRFASLPRRRLSLLPFLLLSFLCLLSMGGVARADIIHLLNGGIIHGEVVRRTARELVVRLRRGELRLRIEEVDYIERQTKEEYLLEIGRGLIRRKHWKEGLRELEAAVKAAPKSEKARAGLIRGLEAYGGFLTANRRADEAERIWRRVAKSAGELSAVWTGGAARRARAALRRTAEIRAESERRLAKARAAKAARRWSAAAALYQEAFDWSPDARAEAAKESAECLIRRAAESFRARRYDNARNDLETALTLDPERADEVENLYVASSLPALFRDLGKGAVEAAETRLTRLLDFSPTNPVVLYYAGRLAEARGNKQRAVMLYTRALRVSAGGRRTASEDRKSPPVPRAAVGKPAELRAALEKNLGLEKHTARLRVFFRNVAAYARADPGDFQKLETAEFVVFHHNAPLAAEVVEALRRHLPRICAALKLKRSWEGKIRVFIYRTAKEYHAATGLPEWTGGNALFSRRRDGKLINTAIHSWQTSSRLLKSVLPHELTHIVVHANLKRNSDLPTALHEGFSILMEPPFRRLYFLRFLAGRLKSKDFIPLEELLHLREYPEAPDFFYAEGFALVQWLVDTRGLPAVAELITKAGRGRTEANLLALARVRTLDELEEKWKAWLREALLRKRKPVER